MKNSLKKIQTVKRPWGSFTRYINNESATVKTIAINAGQSLSLQYHHERKEFWHVLSGAGTIIIGKKKYVATPGKEFVVPPETLHRITAKSAMVILEIATGHFDESDIVRVQDAYGRAKKSKQKKG